MSNSNSTRVRGARSARRFATVHVAVVLLATLAALSCEKNSMNNEDAGASPDTPRPSEPWLDAGSSTGGTSAIAAPEAGGSGGVRMGTTSSAGSSVGIDAGSSGGSSGREGSSGRGGSGANPGAISKPPGANPGHIGRTGSAGSGH